MKSKNTICLWYDKDAEEAARFYAATFPDSRVTAVSKAPSDNSSGKEGDVLVVEFTVLGIPCLGLNGGPVFSHNADQDGNQLWRWHFVHAAIYYRDPNFLLQFGF